MEIFIAWIQLFRIQSMIFCASPIEAFILLLLDKNYEIASIYLLKSMPRYLLLVSLLSFTIICFT